MKRANIVLSALAFFASLAFSQNAREVKKIMDLSRDGRLSIDTYKGSIDIQTWDKPQVDIVARIEPDEWGKEAEDDVERTSIDIDGSPGEVRIRTNYDRLKKRHDWLFGMFDEGSGNLPLVRYTISMPRTARLSIKDYKSDSRIDNIHAPMDFNTYKGSARIAGLEGSIDLETYKGNIELEIGKLSNDSRCETYKGEIGIYMPRTAGFELDTDLGRRADFYSDFDAVVHSKHYSRDESANGAVNGGGPRLRLSTEKGKYRLRAR